MLEIVSDISDVRGLRDLRFGQPASFVGLRRGVIELEKAEIACLLEPIGESVETRAYNQNLPQPLTNGAARAILGEAAAHGDEQAQRPPLRPLPGQRDGAFGVWPQDRKRERIGENEAPLEELMRRPFPAAPSAVTLACPSRMARKVEERRAVCRARQA